MTHYLAQVNIARLRAPLDDPQLAAFVANLEPVNATAEGSPGFLWRLKDEAGGDATSIQAFTWDAGQSAGVIVNMSVWVDMEPLTDFVYGVLHRTVLRRRREWFEPVSEMVTACWWVPEDVKPTTDDAEERLLHLRAHGPTPWAFSLRDHFLAPAAGATYLPIAVQIVQQEHRQGSAQLC